MRLVIVMEWNSKAPLEWDLENVAMYGSRTFETPTRLQFSSHKIDEVKENGRIYSSGVGSGSTFQNSFSGSADAAVKEGLQSFSAVDGFPKDVSRKEEFWGVDGNLPSMGACLGSSVPMTGLKPGRLTYFEDMSAGSTAKTTSCHVDPSSSCPTTKRTRQSHQSMMQTQCCQVEGCNLDLVSAKGYHRRHKICESHSKSPKVIVAGMECRFCQQCSRFHDLSEFDDQKRSCRRRLSDHNARRRRSQPEATQFNSTRLYDQHPRMNFLLNRIPIPVANHTWGIDRHMKGTLAADSLITPAEVGKNAISSVELRTPKRLYIDGSAITSTLDVESELRHAPSLLSSNSWAWNERQPTSLEQLVHENHVALAQPVTQSNFKNWAVSSMEYVRVEVEQTPSGSRTHLLDFNSTGSTQSQHHCS